MDDRFTQNFEKFSQCMVKPLTAFAELNANCANNAAKVAESLSDLLRARRVEDVIEAQMNFIARTNSCAVDYMQKAAEIVSESSNDMMKEMSKTAKNAQSKK